MTLHPLHQLQADYRAESVVELVSLRPPSYLDTNTGLVNEAEAAMLGMNLSGAMVKLLEQRGGVRALLRRWETYCRSRHIRWPDHVDEPACSRIAYAVIRDRIGIEVVADVLSISEGRAGRLLGNALRQMLHWQRLDDRLDPSDSHDPEYCTVCRQEEAG